MGWICHDLFDLFISKFWFFHFQKVNALGAPFSVYSTLRLYCISLSEVGSLCFQCMVMISMLGHFLDSQPPPTSPPRSSSLLLLLWLIPSTHSRSVVGERGRQPCLHAHSAWTQDHKSRQEGNTCSRL